MLGTCNDNDYYYIISTLTIEIMSFQKYSSIEPWTNEKHSSKVKDRYGNCEYIATEKIHGANFQFMITGQIHSIDVKCAKRTAYLEMNEQFYEFMSVHDKYLNDIVNLYKVFLLENDTTESVRIYGELFGGDYPKELVLISPNKHNDECKSKPVQKGIYYCPIIDFLVFDILLTYKNGETKYLTHDEIIKYLCQLEKLRAVPIVFRGSFDEVYKYCIDNVQFKSTIPQYIGYTDDTLDTNYAEGYVIKPTQDCSFGILRGVIKIKHQNFDEIIGYDRNKKKTEKHSEDNQIKFTEELEKYITQNRLENVIGKYGPLMPKPKLIGMLINDAKVDYLKTLVSTQEKEFEKEWKRIYKTLVPMCNKLIFV